MALCKNPRCMTQLGEHYWGEGYCSRRCMATEPGYDRRECGPLLDPNDPTGHTEICRNADEVDAMLEAAEIDPRLPKIIYLRKRGKTLREIGRACGVSHFWVSTLLKSIPQNLLRRCGLRGKVSSRALV